MNKITESTITLLLLLFFISAFSQTKLTENVLKLEDPENRQPATIEDMAWFAGRWTGSGLMGQVEETWNPPLGGTMNGTFRMVKDGQPVFYEMLLIRPDGNSLAYQVKHYNPDFSGWEEKDDFESFRLIKIEGNRYYFDGLTMLREGNKCTIFVAIDKKDGSVEEAAFVFQRSPVPVSPAFVSTPEKRTPLLLLGSYHMSNPGMDQFNLQADDVLTPKRQREIDQIVNQLAAFNPTKVCVEAPYGDSATIARYKAYVAGERELRRSEEEQIGFRLAKKLGHETIYPIDVKMSLNNEGLEEVVAANPAKHGPRLGELEKIGQEAMAIMGKWLAEGTIGEMLYKMNSPENLDLTYQIYLQIFLPLTEDDNYAGPDLVADWNHRNLRIMGNLHKIGCTPEDRVFIVYGQGHIPLFERIAEDSPYFEVVDILPFLK